MGQVASLQVLFQSHTFVKTMVYRDIADEYKNISYKLNNISVNVNLKAKLILPRNEKSSQLNEI